MKRCQCISPACTRGEHAELQCAAEARQVVRSRDWDGGEYAMCAWCAMAARAEGMFERIASGFGNSGVGALESES